MAGVAREIDKLIKAEKARKKPPSLPKDEAGVWALILDKGWRWRPVQEESLASTYRNNVEVWHRRAGKSYVKCAKLIRSALACPFDDGRYAYLAPTQEQVKDIAWHYLTKFAERVPGSELKETAREIWLPTIRGSRARIKLYGVDNPRQALRGVYHDGAVVDEYQDIPETVYTEQLAPTLMDSNRKGVDLFGYSNQWCDFIGTPKGRNPLYHLWQKADLWYRGLPFMMEGEDKVKRPIFSDEWRAAIYPATETGIFSPEELEATKARVGRSKFEQEMLCAWDALITGSIYGQEMADLRNAGRLTAIPVVPFLPVHTGWDLGMDDATAIWLFQLVGEGVNFVHYVEFNFTRFPEIVAELEAISDRGRRFRYGGHILPHDVAVHEMGLGKREHQLKQLGVKPMIIAPKLAEEEGIAATQAMLRTAAFDATHCMKGIDALSYFHRERDEKAGVYRDTPKHDWSSHAAAAMRYVATGLKQLKSRVSSEGARQVIAEF